LKIPLKMGENDDASPPETEPLAKTRARRSNAGARMHEMMFNAEDDEMLAQAYGIIKAEDESSDDEEYVPKELERNNDNANERDGNADDDADDDEDDDDDDDDDGSSDSSTGDSEDDSDDVSDEDDEEEEEDGLDEDEVMQEEDNEDDGKVGNHSKHKVKVESQSNKPRLRDLKPRVKAENGTNSSIQPGSPTKSAYDACSRICSVCLGDQSDEDDEIIECDSCGITVHELCYGVQGDENHDQDNTSVHSVISFESTEPWFCEPCKRSVRNPYCELCPNTGGIFKETDAGRWVHMVCALYTQGVTFNDVPSLTGVSLFELNYALYGSKVRFQFISSKHI
jgi:hypothetical protein